MVSSKHFLIVCPNTFDQKNAIGVYTGKFSRALNNVGCRVSILTSDFQKNSPMPVQYESIFTYKNLNFLGLWESRKLFNEGKFDQVLFQYQPFLYKPKGGLCFGFALFLVYLKFLKKRRFDVMMHELYYPFLGDIKSFILNLLHIIIVFLIGSVADRVYSSTQYFTEILMKKFFLNQKKVFHLPVGCNIDECNIDADRDKQFIGKYKQGSILLGLFGQLHDSKNYNLVVNVLEKVCHIFPSKYRILFIGQDKESLYRAIPKLKSMKIDKYVTCTGFSSEEEVCLAYKNLDLVISYFVDGVSTRRGSFMTSLKFGVPTITTKSNKTDDSLKGIEGVYLLSAEEGLFEQQLYEFLLDYVPNGNAQNAGLINDYYLNYSWKEIVNKYIKSLDEGEEIKKS